MIIGENFLKVHKIILILTVNCEQAVQHTLYILLDKNTVVMHGFLSH